MAIVNFNIPEGLERRISRFLLDKGYSSKAEFFRTAAIWLLDNDKSLPQDERERYLMQAIKEEVINKYRGKRVERTELVPKI